MSASAASPVFTSFAGLASWAGVQTKTVSKGKLSTPLPESSFDHVQEMVGKPATVIWIALNDRAASRKSGPAGSPLFTVQEIVAETGFDEEVVVAGVIRLAKKGLLSKITPDGRIAA